jgi:hypothetical protein
MGEKDEFVNILDIPPSRKGGRNWDEKFLGIPQGQARKIYPSEAHYSTIKTAFAQYKKKHPDTNLKVTTRTVNGERITYILNP